MDSSAGSLRLERATACERPVGMRPHTGRCSAFPMAKTKPVVIKQTLLENALDHLREGIERFFSKEEPSTGAHKFGLSDIYTGVLLLLKERLRRTSPALILQPTKKMPNKTVDFNELLKRLETDAGVTLDATDRAMLEAVRDLRNAVEHAEVSLTLSEAEQMIAGMTSFAYLFARDELGVALEAELDPTTFLRVSDLRKVAERLNKEFAEYMEQRWKDIAAKYMKMSRKKVLALRNVEPYHPRHNPDAEEIYTCPSCGEETVVKIEEDTARLCTNPDCREVYSSKSCERCGEPTFDEDAILCDGCSDHLFGGDD
jgi:formylmethanofuran dehydrogenase subunit E